MRNCLCVTNGLCPTVTSPARPTALQVPQHWPDSHTHPQHYPDILPPPPFITSTSMLGFKSGATSVPPILEQALSLGHAGITLPLPLKVELPSLWCAITSRATATTFSFCPQLPAAGNYDKWLFFYYFNGCFFLPISQFVLQVEKKKTEKTRKRQKRLNLSTFWWWLNTAFGGLTFYDACVCLNVYSTAVSCWCVLTGIGVYVCTYGHHMHATVHADKGDDQDEDGRLQLVCKCFCLLVTENRAAVHWWAEW